MSLDLLGILEKIFIYAIPLVFSLTVHEYAHGYIAKKYGDNTAEAAGRLTLNPVPHIDLLGTVILPLGMLALQLPFIFGWAKPVPINPNRFRDYKKGVRYVALAGPMANLLMLIFWAAIYLAASLVLQRNSSLAAEFFTAMAAFGLLINAVLCIFNLIPIPPLDGSRIVDSYLSPGHSAEYMKLEPYGFFILLALLFLGLFRFIAPLIFGLINITLMALQSLLHLFI